MTAKFSNMPIDKTKIATRLRIHDDFLNDPNAYIQNHGIEIRTVKSTRGRDSGCRTQNLTFSVLNYKGINVKLKKRAHDTLAEVTIDFNPGKCLYGHNGYVLTLSEFLDALALLVTHLKPILQNPDDWVDLIPGLRSGGVAYWKYLEVPFQCDDPDNAIFTKLRLLSPDKPQIPVRHWENSIRIGGDRSDCLLTIYNKTLEIERDKNQPSSRDSSSDSSSDSEHPNILRFEMRLKGSKLVQHLGNERNVEEIAGVERLVRFYPQDLVNAHRASFRKLKGVFSTEEPLEAIKPQEQLPPLGRLLAKVALDQRSSLTLPRLLRHLKFYTGASSNTIGKIRNAAILFSVRPKQHFHGRAIFGRCLPVSARGCKQ